MRHFIPVILGTAREGRRSEKVANYVFQQLAQIPDVETELLDVRDYRIGATGENAPFQEEVGEKMRRADGYIVVSPEYNHSYPGELKMMLDMFYKEYARKPIGFCGVSASPIGGARAVEQLRLAAVEFHMVPIREALYFPLVQDLFDEQGAIQDDSYEKRFAAFMEELLWYAKALKTAREQ